MTMIEKYEDDILESIATFITRVLGLPVYIKDKPFIAPENPYVTLRIITSTSSGGWGQKYMYTQDMYSYMIDNTYQVEIMVYRGRPMPALTYLLSSFMSLDELKYQTMYSKGVSFLSATGLAEANTVLDGDKIQARSRGIFTFNTRLMVEDIATDTIEQINYSIDTYTDTHDNEPLHYTDVIFKYVATS